MLSIYIIQLCSIFLVLLAGYPASCHVANYPRNSKSVVPRQSNSASCQSSIIDFAQPNALGKFNIDWCPQNVYQSNNTLVWRLTPECGTTIVFPSSFQYGKIEARIRVAPGSGVVSSLLLAGPAPSDELDWEWVGKDTWTAQSMYFVKGQRVDPNAQYFHTPGNAAQDMAAGFHNYAIEVNQDNIKWYIDDWLTRTLPKINGVPFPSNAGQARMGIWDGSQTSGWAGTVDWTKAPFITEVEWFKFTPYC